MRSSEPCPRQAVEGSGFCAALDASKARERGSKGGKIAAANERARRAEQAAALTLATADEIRATLTEATRRAYESGDWSVVVSACRCALELLSKIDVEQQIAELRHLVNLHIPQARSHANGAH